MQKPLQMKDKIVVVTGASSGIGRAIALNFAGQGAIVVLASRSREKLNRVAGEIERTGGQALVIPTDVSSPGQVKALAESLSEKYGRVDVLINNAGSAMVGPIEQADFAADTRKMMEVDFFGTINCTHALLPMLRKPGGQIVNMSSVVGRKAFPGFVGYSACMHAIAGYSDGLRQELFDSGITVSTIHPALTQMALLAPVDPINMPAPFRNMTPISPESQVPQLNV